MSELERIPDKEIVVSSNDTDDTLRGKSECEAAASIPRPPIPPHLESAFASATALDALVLGVREDLHRDRYVHLPPPEVPDPQDALALRDALAILSQPDDSRWLPSASTSDQLQIVPEDTGRHHLPPAVSAGRLHLPAATSVIPWRDMPEGDRRVFLATREERREEYASRLAAAGVANAMIRRAETDEFSPEAIERQAAQRHRIGGIAVVRQYRESKWIAQNSPTRDLRPVDPPTVPLKPVRQAGFEEIMEPATLVTAAIPGGKEYSTGVGYVQGILIGQPAKQEQ